ncbi:Uncharacterised protein [Mycobacteroides abscessus subsp. abscessus]|nr:Uncharacterised protein [Mycobacteroides abscessus subsp. abscessus]
MSPSTVPMASSRGFMIGSSGKSSPCSRGRRNAVRPAVITISCPLTSTVASLLRGRLPPIAASSFPDTTAVSGSVTSIAAAVRLVARS